MKALRYECCQYRFKGAFDTQRMAHAALRRTWSAVHHTDHVLRFDHSGWPFTDIVTPFTFSLLVYPLFILAFFLRRGGWGRFAIVLTIFLFTQSAHTFL